MKLLSAETNLESATSVGNNPLVRIYNSHDADTLTVTRKDNTGDQIGTYNVPPNKIMYCQKAYADTLEGGAALKATAVGYSEMLDITWSGTSSSYVNGDLVFYVDAAKSDSYPGSGTTWFDLSGNDYDTEVSTGNSFPTFNSEGYFVFNKSMNVINAPGNSTLNSSAFNKKTISVWFKTPSSFDASNSRGILTMGGGNSNIVIYINDNNLYMGMKKSSTRDGATTTLTTDTWYNAIWVLDAEGYSASDDAQKIYVNGSSIGTAEGRNFSASFALAIGGGSLGATFGNNKLYGHSVHGDDMYNHDVATSAYDGLISIVMVYNKALSATEVTQN